jgi:anti-sigma regulatory factor (Ser/Thr protein kinase)
MSRSVGPPGHGSHEEPVNRTAGEDAAHAVLSARRRTRPAQDWPHVAAFIASDEELLSAALPFLDEGLRAGDLTVLSCSPRTQELIEDARGGRTEGVVVDPRPSLWNTRPPDALASARELLARAAETGSGRLRVLGEVPFGTDPRVRRESERWEAAINRLLAGQPVSALCLFDSRHLPADVLAAARATHNEIVVDGRRVPNRQFRDPADYLSALPTPREAVEDLPPVLALDDASSLVALRRALTAALDAAVPQREQFEDLHLAVSEVAANAFRHGVRPVSARIWTDGGTLVCTITDRGRGFSDPMAGFQPAHGEDLSRGGMGLWLARKLCDHVDLLLGPAGFTVRLSTRLR